VKNIWNWLNSFRKPKIKEYTFTATLRDGIKDNEAIAVLNALNNMGFDKVTNIRMGKIITLVSDNPKLDVDKLIPHLSNPVMEDCSVKIKDI